MTDMTLIEQEVKDALLDALNDLAIQVQEEPAYEKNRHKLKQYHACIDYLNAGFVNIEQAKYEGSLFWDLLYNFENFKYRLL